MPTTAATTDLAHSVTKVLVANRGEIAVRVIRACLDEGLASVAVYAEPDADAPFVQLADEAFALSGETAAESYLDMDKVIAAAKKSGADAVHPGYGFLSENAEFAQKVIDAGLTWIGPSPASIAALGDKVTARHIAETAQAPMAPGTKDPVSGADEVIAFADEHGLPVAIKAAFGGGGRGLKVVFDEADIEEGFASAGREAREAFGRGECYVEKFLTHPRHVEAQVLADAHGNVAVLGTRDCSTQRRFQKLIEEAPAPFLTDQQRTAIEEGAREIIRKANYQSAGTVEYIVSEDGTVSFLEVNTRVQVEHPITEAITGVDIIAEQFRIADGLPLSFVEEKGTHGGDGIDPSVSGHAFEFRINAEDVTNGFAPSPGTVTRFDVPTGPGVRIDTGVRTGGQIPPYYDSLMGKLVVWGPDRETALRRAKQALSEFHIEGVRTVLPFHRDLVESPELTGDSLDVYTDWVDHNYSPSQKRNGVDIEHIYDERRDVVIEIDGKLHTIGFPVALLGGGAGASNDSATAAPSSEAAGAVTTNYEATIVEWLVEDGDIVSKGDAIATIEAMKMESSVKAPRDGQISLAAQQGERVKANAAIATIS